MTVSTGQDSLNTRRKLQVGDEEYAIYSIDAAEEAGAGDLKRLPSSLRVVLENLLRNEDGETNGLRMAANPMPKLHTVQPASYCKISLAFRQWLIWPRCAMP